MARERKAGKASGSKRAAETRAEGPISVMVEFRQVPGSSAASVASDASRIDIPGLTIDPRFEPVPMRPQGQSAAFGGTFIVRAEVASEDVMEELRKRPDVVQVWRDTPIAPFADDATAARVQPAMNAMATCPVPPCDCAFDVAKGTLADVAAYLGADVIWANGFRGAGIVVGVVDGGITAQGRPVAPGETTRRVGRVIGGWPEVDWGTRASAWGEHGNMSATDVLGIAPEAQLYDLRIAGAIDSPGTISRALQAFQWAIDRHRTDGTPHVLTNSWGIYREDWDPAYARDPNHPFTRKVVEAIEEGITVLFAAGNCGETCPDGRCGGDVGPGMSIWGVNGHPRVITVGAVNRNEQFIGYSSQGPAALDPDKPDLCGISHFAGYFDPDNGTSAACPVVAGVAALLLQANPSLTPQQVKDCLKATAKDIGPAGFDQHTGAGIVNARAAFDHCGMRTAPVIDVGSIPAIETPPSRDIWTAPVRETIPRFDVTVAWLDTPPRVDRPPTLPWIDQPPTAPRLDVKPTLPIADEPPTNPVLDQPPTNPAVDQPTLPVIDQMPTVPQLDDPGTLPTLDLGTPPLVDQGGLPTFPDVDEPGKPPLTDTLREGIPDLEQPVLPPDVWGPQAGGWGQAPFVLATQHQAPDWRVFDQMIASASGYGQGYGQGAGGQGAGGQWWGDDAGVGRAETELAAIRSGIESLRSLLTQQQRRLEELERASRSGGSRREGRG